MIWESEIMAAHHRLANTPLISPDDPERVSEEWAELHSAFHEAVLSGADNPRLRGIASQLRDSAELYRRWSVSLEHEHERDVAGEHRGILEAILERDEELAVRRLVDHIQLTTRLLLASGFAESD